MTGQPRRGRLSIRIGCVKYRFIGYGSYGANPPLIDYEKRRKSSQVDPITTWHGFGLSDEYRARSKSSAWDKFGSISSACAMRAGLVPHTRLPPLHRTSNCVKPTNPDAAESLYRAPLRVSRLRAASRSATSRSAASTSISTRSGRLIADRTAYPGRRPG